MEKRILLLFLCVTMIFAVLGPLEAGRLSQSVAEGLNANALLTVPDQLFQYIDQQAFSEMNHTERMTSKESMSTYVFANEDGSWSTYFFDGFPPHTRDFNRELGGNGCFSRIPMV